MNAIATLLLACGQLVIAAWITQALWWSVYVLPLIGRRA